jgi:hypothetical protein
MEAQSAGRGFQAAQRGLDRTWGRNSDGILRQPREVELDATAGWVDDGTRGGLATLVNDPAQSVPSERHHASGLGFDLTGSWNSDLCGNHS